jgi:hypothetical protein
MSIAITSRWPKPFASKSNRFSRAIFGSTGKSFDCLVILNQPKENILDLLMQLRPQFVCLEGQKMFGSSLFGVGGAVVHTGNARSSLPASR